MLQRYGNKTDEFRIKNVEFGRIVLFILLMLLEVLK